MSSLLLFLSGAAALGYQMAWTRMFATGIGHETPAMLAVVFAFMAGSAAGAWLLDRRISAAAQPIRWYAVLELIIGAWAAASVLLLPTVNQLAIRLIGQAPNPVAHWLLAFLVPGVVLLPATMAMGATFPAMERYLASWKPGRRAVGLVYASNTLGAVAGTLASTFLVAPRLGFAKTILALGSLNLVSGVLALLLPQPQSAEHEATSERQPSALKKKRLLAALFVTGLAGIGFEAAGTRVLSQVLENTIYTFAAVLAVYLLGTAIGAALYQNIQRRAWPNMLPALLGLTAVACAAGTVALSFAQPLHDRLRNLDSGITSLVIAEATVATAVFGLATIAMGALFTHLLQAYRVEHGRLGAALAINTLGAALAPALFGALLTSLAGAKWTLLGCSLLYLAVLPRISRFVVTCAAIVLAVAWLLPSRLHNVTVPPGGRITEFRDGVMAAVAVVEDTRGDRVLRVNNRFQMGGTAAADAEYRGAHVPMLLHPAPRRVLFLGLGTGITAAGAVLYDRVQIDGVELVPEILDVLPRFEPQNRSIRLKPNVRLHAADARRFVRTTTNRYDVIVADLFHPARDGAGSLYTVEHFAAMRDRLAPGGLVCQWLPLHQLDHEMLALIARSFASVFPSTEGFLLRFNVDIPVIGLIGRMAPVEYTDAQVERVMGSNALGQELRRLALGDSLRLLGQFVDLSTLHGHGPLNRDDFPLVTFRAPALTYDAKEEPFRRLEPLLTERLPRLSAPPAFAERLHTFVRARNVYLRGLIEEAEGKRDAALQHYLESARVSPDFTAGYAQCLTIASMLATSQPEKARALLEALIAAQPERPVARQMLERLQQRQ